jgi:hypothetical protein
MPSSTRSSTLSRRSHPSGCRNLARQRDLVGGLPANPNRSA